MTVEKFNLPKKVLKGWQEILNLVVSMAHTRAALIMHLENDYLETFLASENKGNPYNVGEASYFFNSGLYCERVIEKQSMLLVANARKSVEWEHNPDMKLGMVSYLGFPIRLPDGKPSGTICLLDDKENAFSPDIINFMKQMRNLVENNLLVEEQIYVERDLLRKLRNSERKYKLIAENTLDIISTVNLKGELTYISPSIQKHTGYTPAEYVKLPVTKMFTQASCKLLEKYFTKVREDVAQGKKVGTFQEELRGICKDGSVDCVEMVLSGIHNNVEGEPIELVGVTRDVTERRKLEDKVFHLAMHDALTDLPNMRFANEFLGQAIQKAVKHGTKIGIMFIDLNRFKPINDTYGHRTGDLLLGHAAEMIKAVLPADAIAARIGGDEFLVIASNINCKDEVARLAEKIIKNLVNPFLYKKEKIVVGASLGIAMYPDDGRQAADLIDLADDAMYNAKKCGDDKYMFVS